MKQVKAHTFSCPNAQQAVVIVIGVALDNVALGAFPDSDHHGIAQAIRLEHAM